MDFEYSMVITAFKSKIVSKLYKTMKWILADDSWLDFNPQPSDMDFRAWTSYHLRDRACTKYFFALYLPWAPSKPEKKSWKDFLSKSSIDNFLYFTTIYFLPRIGGLCHKPIRICQ